MIILIGIGSSLLAFLVFFWFFSNTDKAQEKHSALANAAGKNFSISSKDIETIAGADVISTQLDLARAYVETERKSLAKNILNNVLAQGSVEQKQEAKRLLAVLQAAS